MKTNLCAILTAGLILGACSNDNEPTTTEVVAVITTNLGSRVQTRMVDSDWAENDAIGIFSLSDEMEGVEIDGIPVPSNEAANLKYTRTAGDGWDGGAGAFRFKNPAIVSVGFKAYYPYTEGTTVDGKIDFDVTDQSAAAQAQFDFLYADKDKDGNFSTGDIDHPNINFQFAHSMTKIVIVLQADGTSVKDLGTMSPTLKGLKAKGAFSLADGKAALAGDATVASLLLTNQTETTGTATKQSFVAIVPPQPAPSNAFLTIASGGDNYLSAKILGSQELAAGNCYTVTITVKRMELVVESSDITRWTPQDGGSGNAFLQ